MSRSLSRRALVGAGLAVLVTLPLVTGPAQAGTAPAQSIGSAEEQARALRAELARLREQAAASVAAYEQAEEQLGAAVTRSVAMTRALEQARAQARGTDDTARQRISALYRSGGPAGLWVTLAQATSPQDLASRYANIDAVLSADTRARQDVGVAASEVAQAEAAAREVADEATRLSTSLQDESARLAGLLEAQAQAVAAADAEVRRLVEVQREQQRAAAVRALALSQAAFSPTGSARTGCPVGPDHSFVDTWQAPRSGGRQHQGTDVFAPHGSPAYAVVDGVVDKTGDGGLGGITLWLRGDDGTRYYYAHNSRNLVTVGQRVTAGQVVALVGKTGNAETTPPHVHFEVHPGGGAAVNPYPWLAAVCAG